MTEPELQAILTGSAVACLSCGDRAGLDDLPTVAQAQLTAFIASHESCPNFQITLTLELPDHH